MRRNQCKAVLSAGMGFYKHCPEAAVTGSLLCAKHGGQIHQPEITSGSSGYTYDPANQQYVKPDGTPLTFDGLRAVIWDDYTNAPLHSKTPHARREGR